MEQKLFMSEKRIGIEMKKVVILGGGLSGISTAYFLQNQDWVDSITILEKEPTTGGLCRTIEKNGYLYDIGPHILFSKDKEMLNLMLSVLKEKNSLKRSNQILYKGKYVQYPFENDLSKLPEEDLDYCIKAFNNNPYENYEASNMIQFFLKTFGEGITNTYLRPYNEKIWKYDPAFMNTSMVDRIPKPTQEEIRRSAAGETVDGYVHQLYFSYPTNGGIESVVNGFKDQLNKKCKIYTDTEAIKVRKDNSKYFINCANGKEYISDMIISTIPIHEFSKAYANSTQKIKNCVNELRYNSIAIAFVKTKKDLCGDNYAFMIPDKNVIFHRISKMDFLGESYHHSTDEATYMIEVTYRKNDHIDTMSDVKLLSKIKEGLITIKFAEKLDDIEIIDLTKYQYAYVIYDLNHAENMNKIREFYNNEGIILNGRFGNFEYWNMDRILRESFELAKNLNKTIN